MAKTHKKTYLINKNNKNCGGSSKKSSISSNSLQYIPKYEIINRPTASSLIVYLEKIKL